jgi:hypothetical protein
MYLLFVLAHLGILCLLVDTDRDGDNIKMDLWKIAYLVSATGDSGSNSTKWKVIPILCVIKHYVMKA